MTRGANKALATKPECDQQRHQGKESFDRVAPQAAFLDARGLVTQTIAALQLRCLRKGRKTCKVSRITLTVAWTAPSSPRGLSGTSRICAVK